MTETLVIVIQSQGGEWRVGAVPASDLKDPYVYLEDTNNPSEIGVYWVAPARVVPDWEILSKFPVFGSGAEAKVAANALESSLRPERDIDDDLEDLPDVFLCPVTLRGRFPSREEWETWKVMNL